jgi:hypothetical protein
MNAKVQIEILDGKDSRARVSGTSMNATGVNAQFDTGNAYLGAPL